MKNRSQPIAIQNVIDYLIAALTNPNGRGQVFEIGGPDLTTYGDLMLRYARIRGLKRRMFLLPGMPIGFMAFGVGMMTPVPYPIAYALIGGLSADSLVKHPEALNVFPEVNLIDFNSAAKEALEKTHPSHIERVWDDGRQGVKSIKHEGCFIDHREMKIGASPEKVFRSLKQWVDTRSRFTTVKQTNKQIIICVKDQSAGEKWIEWRVDAFSDITRLSQTVFFSPRGLPGFLYWFLLYPFHLIRSHGFIKSIANQSQSQ